jgi:hypothetical protein
MKFAAIPAILACALLFTVGAAAQELECTVTINTELLTAEARENLNTFTEAVQNYINSYRWTDEDLGGEKILFTLTISFQGSPSPNRYTAQAYIGSQRKVYGMDKNTALLRVIDENWEFLYQPNQQILHDETLFDPLASFLDYYCYVVIGLDFESYQPRAGIPYLEEAMNVVNTAASGGKGWQIGSPTEYTRGEYIDELLSPIFQRGQGQEEHPLRPQADRKRDDADEPAEPIRQDFFRHEIPRDRRDVPGLSRRGGV